MTDPDLLRDVIGMNLAAERTAENLIAYAEILSEIAKLRDLDLSTVHPAVVFRPIAMGRDGSDE